jgi:hypothetical protein
VDEVTENIDNEVKRARALRRAVVRARREAERQEYDDELEIERAVKYSLPVCISWSRMLTMDPPGSSLVVLKLAPSSPSMISSQLSWSYQGLLRRWRAAYNI